MKSLLLIVLGMSLCVSVSSCAGLRGKQRQSGALIGVQSQGWEMLGKRKVRLAGDHDVIPVTMLKGTYKRIMIVVHDSSLEMSDITVQFANGETYSPNVRLHFSEDTRSRAIDLPGIKRAIRRVDFHYRSKRVLTGRATVELWGKP